MKQYPVTVAGIRELLENILSLQRNFESGPSWFEAYSTLYEHWLT
jgi:hypothetical protein